MSREHAEIANEDGRYTLRDRGSRYGTFVNGEQVTERVLQAGDRIRLGRTDAIELLFMTEGAEDDGPSSIRALRTSATSVTWRPFSMDYGRSVLVVCSTRSWRW